MSDPKLNLRGDYSFISYSLAQWGGAGFCEGRKSRQGGERAPAGGSQGGGAAGGALLLWTFSLHSGV